ncbi:TonB-dependent receptor [Xanthomonas campestris pv. raphani]|uniref:TonB-dependent receptor n=1 Tax=Xanthomonas campestris TaxID=339 RepID=UPI002B23BED3|nr:TonB-dependent receptor [Xanthomonas campestris]MEA9884102.1 TonB-dependent receptor [Xanthomonas campestris pv. raphani]MEB2182076.1 TonB-dependent receptor [Xanthomonas campestris pv. campestris]
MRLLHPDSRPACPPRRTLPSRRAVPLALGLAVTGCLPRFASAIEAPVEADAQTLDAVQVRNPFQSQNTRAIATKQAAPTIVDSVAADSIGQLPDFNIGDALRRVTGVSTVEYQGEPRYVTVRGLNGNYNSMLIDGFAFASNDIGSRQALMDVLPANFVDRIDVMKSLLPENDGAAIGGVTNLVTATGFARPDGLLTASAKGGANLMGQRYGGRTPVGEGELKWSKRFGREGEFAFLGAASVWRREISVPQQENGGGLNWYGADGARAPLAYAGVGAAVPSERRWYNYDNTRERRGVTLRVDWQPDGPLSGHVSGYAFRQREASDRNTQAAQVQNSGRLTRTGAQSGTLDNVNQLVELGQLRWKRGLSGLNGELLAELPAQWRGALRASTSRATVDNPQTWDRFQQNRLAYAFDWTGTLPAFAALNPAQADDPARYANLNHQQERTTYAERVSDLQLDLRRNMDEDSRGLGLAWGLRQVRTHMQTAFARTTWSGLPYALDNVLGSPICALGCTMPMMTIDPALADVRWDTAAGQARGVVDTSAQNSGSYNVDEQVRAGFAQAQWRGERWQVAGGVRLEQTRFGSAGLQASGATWTPVSAVRTYRNWLPSFAAQLQTSANGMLRIGASRSIGRPRLDQMALNGGVLTLGSTPPTLNQGNPDLQPRRSQNLDLGHDWTFDDGGSLLSVALFHKTISNEIFRYGQLQDIDGQQVLVTQPRNTDRPVRLRGAELGAIKELGPWLPALNGLSVGANLTLLDVAYPVVLGDGTRTSLTVLPQQPKQLWNLSMNYARGPLRASLAWNHTGELWDDRYPNYSNALEFYRNRYQQPLDRIDLKLGWDMSPTVAVSLDVLNLAGQGYQYRIGRQQEYVQSAWKMAPTVMLGVNVKL